MCTHSFFFCHQKPLRKVLLHIVFSSHRVFIYMDKLPWDSPFAPPVPVLLPSPQDRRSKPFTIFMALCWTPVAPCHSCFLSSGALNWTQQSRCGLTSAAKAKDYLQPLAGSGLPNTLRMSLVFAATACCWLLVSFGVCLPGPPRPFLTGYIPVGSDPSLCWSLQLFLPRDRT